MKPDGYAVVQSDGHFVGIWKDEKTAELIVNRSPSVKGERIEPMVYLKSTEQPHVPTTQV